ncbi:MAG: YebC/PmpR family DNA-binding transcriptional regulator [FCB group bacterium]|nr:YebC/PmpR family DNA-binding transcriptional regulator [FCB group bacterium]
MSGHSKWATIRRKKEKTDAARGRVFTRLIKEISVAARMGGGDIEANPRLRSAVATAKAANMPAANIDKGIKKGTGELPGVIYDEIVYEAYAPGGVALILNCLTDNKNRTVSEIRHLISKRGGNLAETGAVGYMFDRKGVITVDPKGLSEDDVMELALDAGAEDMRDEDDSYEIITEPNDFEAVRTALEESPVEIVSAEISMLPSIYVKVEGESVAKLLRLLDDLEEHDDIQDIWGNFDIDDDELEEE